MIRNIPGTDTAVTDASFESGLLETILRLWTEADSGAVCIGSNPTGGALDYQVIWALNWPYAKSLRSHACSPMPPYAARHHGSRNISGTARQALPPHDYLGAGPLLPAAIS